MSLPLVVLLPFLGALAAPLFAQGGRTAIAVISCVPAIIGLAALYPHWAILADGGIAGLLRGKPESHTNIVREARTSCHCFAGSLNFMKMQCENPELAATAAREA